MLKTKLVKFCALQVGDQFRWNAQTLTRVPEKTVGEIHINAESSMDGYGNIIVEFIPSNKIVNAIIKE